MRNAPPTAPRSHRRRSPRPGRNPKPSGSSGTSSPRGLVSGATKISPCSAQAARYSPFSVTLAWVQVRPDRYQTTGSFAAARLRGRKIENAISVPVAAEACLTTSCRPPWDLTSGRSPASLRPAGAARTACCRRDRADRRDRACRTASRDSRAGPRPRSRRPRRPRVPGVDFLRAVESKPTVAPLPWVAASPLIG